MFGFMLIKKIKYCKIAKVLFYPSQKFQLPIIHMFVGKLFLEKNEIKVCCKPSFSSEMVTFQFNKL